MTPDYVLIQTLPLREPDSAEVAGHKVSVLGGPEALVEVALCPGDGEEGYTAVGVRTHSVPNTLQGGLPISHLLLHSFWKTRCSLRSLFSEVLGRLRDPPHFDADPDPALVNDFCELYFQAVMFSIVYTFVFRTFCSHNFGCL